MEAYLDNSATTKVTDTVKDIVVKTMVEDYGNPSSLHLKGVESEKYIKNSKEIIGKTLKCDEKEIIFTSGGTESNNLAILGTAMAHKRRGNHIITSKIEHPSVLNTVKYLEEQGFEITYLDVDKNGVVSIEELKEKLRKDTILVSIMHVNNEIGSVMPIEEIGKYLKEKHKDTLFHVDGIQSYGKYKIIPKRMGIDLLSVSGHKIHGPKGVGFLYKSEKARIVPIIFGGGQQKNYRSGTENVPGIAGLGKACEEAYADLEKEISRITDLKDFLIDEFSKIENVKINSKKGNGSAPHIISVSFIGVRSEVMLHSLEDMNIFISSGSACASNKGGKSGTLANIKIGDEQLDSTVRFSISKYTTKEELIYTVSAVNTLLPKLRMFVRKK